jgi:hypothetical protein
LRAYANSTARLRACGGTERERNSVSPALLTEKLLAFMLFYLASCVLLLYNAELS